MTQINSPNTKAAFDRSEAKKAALGIHEAFPFKANFFESPMGAMHFIDEGEGDPVLMLHGNPTWSFLYRNLIPPVARTHRVIAPDHIGFGLSDKPIEEAAYSLKAHIDNLESLVLALDLRRITLVMQDWGGPIGLGVAARDPDRLKLPFPLLMMRARGIGDLIVRRFGFFERQVMTLATAKKREAKTRAAYTKIFESAADRGGVMAFPRMIPAQPSHPSAKILQTETGLYLDAFTGPARIFWGTKDPLIPIGALTAWKKRLPQAEVTEFSGARHYLQDDEPDALATGLTRFLADIA